MQRSMIVTAVVAAISCHSPRAVVHHFDNDYEAARAEAARAQLPLVVEVWAPW
jgi:hypothetical protein